jgi:hypothetical protein
VLSAELVERFATELTSIISYQHFNPSVSLVFYKSLKLLELIKDFRFILQEIEPGHPG